MLRPPREFGEPQRQAPSTTAAFDVSEEEAAQFVGFVGGEDRLSHLLGDLAAALGIQEAETFSDVGRKEQPQDLGRLALAWPQRGRSCGTRSASACPENRKTRMGLPHTKYVGARGGIRLVLGLMTPTWRKPGAAR